MSSEVLGVESVKKKLEALRLSVQNKLVKASITAGGRVLVKAIKKQIPSRWKDGRKTVRQRFMKGQRYGSPAAMAKVGIGVAMKKKKIPPTAKRNRKGVGIGFNNFHWFVLGTEERETGSKRVGAHRRGVKNKRVATGGKVRRTGRMKKPDSIVQRGAQNGRAAAIMAMAENLRDGIEREAAKK